jgi:hypothetical protein
MNKRRRVGGDGEEKIYALQDVMEGRIGPRAGPFYRFLRPQAFKKGGKLHVTSGAIARARWRTACDKFRAKFKWKHLDNRSRIRAALVRIKSWACYRDEVRRLSGACGEHELLAGIKAKMNADLEEYTASMRECAVGKIYASMNPNIPHRLLDQFAQVIGALEPLLDDRTFCGRDDIKKQMRRFSASPVKGRFVTAILTTVNAYFTTDDEEVLR